MNLKNYGGHFDLEKLKDRFIHLEQDTQREGFWNNADTARELLRNLDQIKRKINACESLRQALDDAGVLLELHSEIKSVESDQEVKESLAIARARLASLQLEKMLSGELDANGCYLSINAGAGGTESCDWAAMLTRMYMRYAERHGYSVSLISSTEGDGAGYSSITLQIDGAYAYGYLKAENGVHRLVRISPFDSSARRHTSFCSVFVHAQVDDDIKVELKEDDIEMEAYRSSGAGGQKVNKTSSAVRLTHKPTGIVVACQIERSQHQNRATALKMLKAQLYELEVARKNAERDKVEAGKKDIAWGSQIRSYVLHPYKMVKDHRTDHESSQPFDVLDGDLDSFIKSYLLEGTGA